MLSAGQPTEAMSARKLVCIWVNTPNWRSRSLPMQVSTMIRRSPARITKAWNEILHLAVRREEVRGQPVVLTAACSAEQASSRKAKGSRWSFSSTMRQISTPPTVHLRICSMAISLCS